MGVEFGLTVGVLVYVAFVFDLFGFLARDELWLRLLMLGGSAMYLIYFYLVADAPLWDAIITDTTLALANLAMIARLVLERTTLAMPPDTAALARRFDMLSPGQVRRLLRHASDITLTEPHHLTREGAPVAHLFYVVSGAVDIRKGADRVIVDPQLFVGELAFLSGQPATADVQLGTGARYLMWEADALRGLMAKAPGLEIGLQAQLNRDLVAKVANSLPLGSARGTV